MRDTADALISKGLAKLGYTSVDMDGGWYNFNKAPAKRGWKGPWDMRGVADYLHAKGLKMGMYVTGGMAGVYKHEDVWSEVMFREWAADSVKVDHMCANICETAPGEINHPVGLRNHGPSRRCPAGPLILLYIDGAVLMKKSGLQENK